MSAVYFEMHQNLMCLAGWIDEYMWVDIYICILCNIEYKYAKYKHILYKR